jgi:steroid 5-alpha reductase family enzyme
LGKGASLGIVTAVYVLAGLVAGWGVVDVLPSRHPIEAYFYADLVATVVVFAGSMVLRNSSVYDPYWSVAPPLIVAGWLVADEGGVHGRQALVLILVTLWAVRLTANWVTGWRGLAHEDWRYVQIREQTTGRLPWWLVTFTGIHLVPTLVVFLALIAAWPGLHGYKRLGLIDLLAVVVMLGSILLEAISDRQLRAFAGKPENAGKTVDIGPWRWSRHPNYLGEIGIWWGLWLFGLAADPSWWWTVIGPLAMVALFAGVSVPLMEKRNLARRPDYAAYQRRVAMLVPGLAFRRAPKI